MQSLTVGASVWRRWLGAVVVAIALGVLAAACHRAPSCPPKDRANLNFTAKDGNGADVKLASYAGKPLVLNFWATWCTGCKEEMPALMALAEKYKSKNITVLGISVDDPPAEMKKFADAKKVNYPLVTSIGQDELLEAYDAQIGIPITWFVSSSGCLVNKHLGTATQEWFDQQMKALL